MPKKLVTFFRNNLLMYFISCISCSGHMAIIIIFSARREGAPYIFITDFTLSVLASYQANRKI